MSHKINKQDIKLTSEFCIVNPRLIIPELLCNKLGLRNPNVLDAILVNSNAVGRTRILTMVVITRI